MRSVRNDFFTVNATSFLTQLEWRNGLSEIEGKAARVAASERGQRAVSMERMGWATRVRRGYGAPAIERKM